MKTAQFSRAAFAMRSALLTGSSLALSAIATAALAGPPYVTDDPDPVEFGHFQTTVSTQGTKAGGQVSGQALNANVAYGLIPNLEVSVAVPLAFTPTASGAGSFFGLHELDLGAKYRFIQEQTDGWVPEVAFAPGVTVPVGSQGGDVRIQLPFWAQKTIGDWTTFGGGGFNTNPGVGNKNFWSFGWALTRQIVPNFSLGGELFGQTASTVGGKAQLSAGLGSEYDVTDTWHLLGSVNTGIVDREDNQYSYYFGIQWNL
jgi:hypothetical protein